MCNEVNMVHIMLEYRLSYDSVFIAVHGYSTQLLNSHLNHSALTWDLFSSKGKLMYQGSPVIVKTAPHVVSHTSE